MSIFNNLNKQILNIKLPQQLSEQVQQQNINIQLPEQLSQLQTPLHIQSLQKLEQNIIKQQTQTNNT